MFFLLLTVIVRNMLENMAVWGFVFLFFSWAAVVPNAFYRWPFRNLFSVFLLGVLLFTLYQKYK